MRTAWRFVIEGRRFDVTSIRRLHGKLLEAAFVFSLYCPF